jgi:hypothetical protein
LEVLEADGARIFVKEEESASGREPSFILVEASMKGSVYTETAPRSVPLGRGVAWRSMNRQESILLPLVRGEKNLPVDPLIDCDSGGELATASIASCPLVNNLLGSSGTVQVARACEKSRMAYSWQDMCVLEQLAAKVATALSMQSLRKTSSNFDDRLKRMARVWDHGVTEPSVAMERTLQNMRAGFSADVCSLYEVTRIADSTVLLLRGVASCEGGVVMPAQVPLKGILGTVALDNEPIIASRDETWGWDCPQFNPGIDLPLPRLAETAVDTAETTDTVEVTLPRCTHTLAPLLLCRLCLKCAPSCVLSHALDL